MPKPIRTRWHFPTNRGRAWFVYTVVHLVLMIYYRVYFQYERLSSDSYQGVPFYSFKDIFFLVNSFWKKKYNFCDPPLSVFTYMQNTVCGFLGIYLGNIFYIYSQYQQLLCIQSGAKITLFTIYWYFNRI